MELSDKLKDRLNDIVLTCKNVDFTLEKGIEKPTEEMLFRLKRYFRHYLNFLIRKEDRRMLNAEKELEKLKAGTKKMRVWQLASSLLILALSILLIKKGAVK